MSATSAVTFAARKLRFCTEVLKLKYNLEPQSLIKDRNHCVQSSIIHLQYLLAIDCTVGVGRINKT
ncbi:hypothetical protein BS78_03G216500 [Paspalum vaginatum]|nr:hypothetical protein BS78_03G216500 [Paspalum vaginatum]